MANRATTGRQGGPGTDRLLGSSGNDVTGGGSGVDAIILRMSRLSWNFATAVPV